MELAALLRQAGLDTPEAQARGLALLVAAGLTRPGKTGLAADKLHRAHEALGALVLVCGDAQCGREAQQRWPGGELVVVSAAGCRVCGGSDVARALGLLRAALLGARVRRLLILGGTPPQHREFGRLTQDGRIEVRCIDGSEGAHTRAQATANLEWADLLVLWASTPLAHKVSQAYTHDVPERARRPHITVARRSVTALCEAVLEHLARRPTARP
jgi:hypothetical protein